MSAAQFTCTLNASCVQQGLRHRKWPLTSLQTALAHITRQATSARHGAAKFPGRTVSCGAAFTWT